MQLSKYNILREIKEKINNDHFYGALKITITAIIAFLFFSKPLGSSATFGMILGAAMCSPIDISSSFKDKIMSITLAAILVPLVTIIITLSFGQHIIFYFVFATLTFSTSIISLYGQRANQLSFALLLTIAIAFKNSGSPGSAYSSGLFMFCGGMLYLLVSIIFYSFRPTKFLNYQVANCVDKVADYLQLRSQLWSLPNNIDEIKEEQLALQVQINDTFQKTNQYLDYTKMRLVNTRSNQQTILAISFLNDIMTLAISTTFDRRSIMLNLKEEEKLAIFSAIGDLNITFSNTLKQLSDCIKFNTIYKESNELDKKVQNLGNLVQNQEQIDHETKIYLDSILQYINTQLEKIQSLIHLYSGEINLTDFKSDIINNENIIKPTEYRLKTLIDNLNFKSIYFRYAIRITISLLLGYFIGSYIALQREYWVLLTIVVIMRPGYGLTKERMNNRVIGTLIGALISIVILHYVTNHFLLGFIVFIAILLGYWYTSIDYKIGVIFITIYILIVTGMLSTDADISVYYRVLNTLTGAAIAFFASSFLWPSWESSSVKTNLTSSLNSTLTYVIEFKNIKIDQKADTMSLKKCSQDAYIAIGNLMASYQRLIQEPKKKQKNKSELYEIALLNQTVVGAITTLATFMKINSNNIQTYNKLVDTSIQNLTNSLTNIQLSNTPSGKPSAMRQTSQNKQETSINTNLAEIANEDMQIVMKQLIWINSLTSKIESESRKII